MNNQFPPINENQLIKIEAFKERLKKREIWLNGLIDDSLIEKLYVNLIDLESQNNSLPITVVINSNGGNLWESAVATDIMGTLSCPIKTIALAKANSGGFMIFMAGEERICHDNTELMMHDITSTFWNKKISSVSNDINYLKEAQKKMAQFFSIQTEGRTTPNYWLELFESGKEKWFSVDEAVKLGIVHKVIKRASMINPENNIRQPNTWDIMDFARSQQ